MAAPDRQGYTLVEMLVVLTLMSILLAVAVPGFDQLIQKQKIASAAGDLFAAITLTRSAAIQRAERVDLIAADGKDWRNGWVVLIDSNGNQQLDPGEKIIHAHPAVGAGIAIKSVLTDSAKTYIAFTATGRTRTNAHEQTPQAGHLAVTLGKQQRRIILNFLGRPRLCNPAIDKGCGA